MLRAYRAHPIEGVGDGHACSLVWARLGTVGTLRVFPLVRGGFWTPGPLGTLWARFERSRATVPKGLGTLSEGDLSTHEAPPDGAGKVFSPSVVR